MAHCNARLLQTPHKNLQMCVESSISWHSCGGSIIQKKWLHQTWFLSSEHLICGMVLTRFKYRFKAQIPCHELWSHHHHHHHPQISSRRKSWNKTSGLSSSSRAGPILEHSRFHGSLPLFVILSSSPCRVQEMLSALRPLSTVRIHDCLGRPGSLQWLGNPEITACCALEWSIRASDLATCPKSRTRLSHRTVESYVWLVHPSTSVLVTTLCIIEILFIIQSTH